MRKRKEFGSDLQYKKYLLAVEYVEKIQSLMDKGYLVFDEDNKIIEGKMIVPEDDSFCAVANKVGNCTQGLVCFAYGDDGIPWIEETIKDIHALFRSYTCVNPKDIHPIYIKHPKYKRGIDGFIKGTEINP